MMLQKVYLRGLWISAILFIVLCAVQGWSGNWSVFYFVWPGSNSGIAFTRFVAGLASYHMKMGYGIGVVSILIVAFAFLSKSNLYVRIFAVLGLVLTAVAALGGYVYVHSSFQDRLSLGQMADSFIAALTAYFIMLIFLNRTPRFPWDRKEVA